MAGDPRQVRNALRAMEAHLQDMVEPAEQQLRDAEQVIARVTEMIEDAMAGLNRALDDAESDLAYCESQVDDDGRRPNCSRYYRRVQKIRNQISHLVSMSQQFERSTRQYTTAAAGLREVINEDIPGATHWLRDRERALEKFESGSVGIKSSGSSKTSGSHSDGPSIDTLNALGAAAITTRNPALLSAFNSYFEGMGNHGYKYAKSSQNYLRDIPNDTKEPAYIRGWVRQELNRIEQHRKAIASGMQPPGGTARTTWDRIRAVPGMDVGHRFPGLDLKENYRLEPRSWNRGRPGRARRLGISDKIR